MWFELIKGYAHYGYTLECNTGKLSAHASSADSKFAT